MMGHKQVSVHLTAEQDAGDRYLAAVEACVEEVVVRVVLLAGVVSKDLQRLTVLHAHAQQLVPSALDLRSDGVATKRQPRLR